MIDFKLLRKVCRNVERSGGPIYADISLLSTAAGHLPKLLDHIEEQEQMCIALTKELDDGERVSRLLDERDQARVERETHQQNSNAAMRLVDEYLTALKELRQERDLLTEKLRQRHIDSTRDLKQAWAAIDKLTETLRETLRAAETGVGCWNDGRLGPTGRRWMEEAIPKARKLLGEPEES